LQHTPKILRPAFSRLHHLRFETIEHGGEQATS
jgi:hypothetical protein